MTLRTYSRSVTEKSTIDVIIEMIKEAHFNSCKIKASLNGIEVVVEPKSNASDVYDNWEKEMQERSSYNSNDKKAIEERERVEFLRNKEIVARLIKDMFELDSGEYNKIIDWMCKFQKPAESGASSNDQNDLVIKFFEMKGFIRNENCGDRFDNDDEINVARYLIGQCLDCIDRFGSPSKIILSMSREWRERFGIPEIMG